MTSRRSLTKCEDVLYTNVCNTPGGLAGAVRYVNANRNKRAISEDYLRKLLAREEGREPSVALMRLLTRWMLEEGNSNATEHVTALSSEFDLVAVELPPAPTNGWSCENTAITKKTLNLSTLFGELSRQVNDALADDHVCDNDADAVVAAVSKLQVELARLSRNAKRAAQKNKAAGIRRVA